MVHRNMLNNPRRSCPHQRRPRRRIFRRQPRHQHPRRHHPVQCPDPLPRSPDIRPRPLTIRREIHPPRLRPRQVVGVQPRRNQARPQIVPMHPGNGIRVNNARRRPLNDRLLIPRRRIRLRRRNERRPHISQIRPHRLRRQHRPARRNAPRKRQRPRKPPPDLRHQRKRRQRPRMPPGPRRHRNQPIRPLLDRLPRKPVIDHVMPHQRPAPMRRRIHLRPRPQRRDIDRHPVVHAHLQIRLQPPIAPMHNLVHRKRRRRPLRMPRIPIRQPILYPPDPNTQLRRRPRIQRRKTPHHPRRTLRNHQLRVRNNEQRRRHHRNPQPLQGRGERHPHTLHPQTPTRNPRQSPSPARGRGPG